MEKSKRLEREFANLNERVLTLEDNIPSRSHSRANSKKPTPKNNSSFLNQDTLQMSGAKENPFLKGRMGTGGHSPRQNFETEGRASFGYNSLKSRGLQQLERETNLSDLEDKKSQSRKRGRSRSISNKSLNNSYMSGYSGKENQSPRLKKNSTRKNSKKADSRKRSESLSVSVTPKRRTSVRSTDSYKSDRSGRSNSRHANGGVSNKKPSNIKQMQNKIELERKMREEKIKKLIQKSKPPSDTVKII